MSVTRIFVRPILTNNVNVAKFNVVKTRLDNSIEIWDLVRFSSPFEHKYLKNEHMNS